MKITINPENVKGIIKNYYLEEEKDVDVSIYPVEPDGIYPGTTIIETIETKDLCGCNVEVKRLVGSEKLKKIMNHYLKDYLVDTLNLKCDYVNDNYLSSIDKTYKFIGLDLNVSPKELKTDINKNKKIKAKVKK